MLEKKGIRSSSFFKQYYPYIIIYILIFGALFLVLPYEKKIHRHVNLNQNELISYKIGQRVENAWFSIAWSANTNLSIEIKTDCCAGLCDCAHAAVYPCFSTYKAFNSSSGYYKCLLSEYYSDHDQFTPCALDFFSPIYFYVVFEAFNNTQIDIVIRFFS